jgi:hypothetical protein
LLCSQGQGPRRVGLNGRLEPRSGSKWAGLNGPNPGPKPGGRPLGQEPCPSRLLGGPKGGEPDPDPTLRRCPVVAPEDFTALSPLPQQSCARTDSALFRLISLLARHIQDAGCPHLLDADRPSHWYLAVILSHLTANGTFHATPRGLGPPEGPPQSF